MNKYLNWVKKYCSIAICIACILTSVILTKEKKSSVPIQIEQGESIDMEDGIQNLTDMTFLPLFDRHVVGDWYGDNEYSGFVLSSQMTVNAIKEQEEHEVLLAIDEDAMYIKSMVTMRFGKQEAGYSQIKLDTEYYAMSGEIFFRVVDFSGDFNQFMFWWGLEKDEPHYDYMKALVAGNLMGKWVRARDNEWIADIAVEFFEEYALQSVDFLVTNYDRYEATRHFMNGSAPCVKLSLTGAATFYQASYYFLGIDNTEVGKLDRTQVVNTSSYIN